jgi:hypothetical protein
LDGLRHIPSCLCLLEGLSRPDALAAVAAPMAAALAGYVGAWRDGRELGGGRAGRARAPLIG